jgi:hypothetical protein
MAQAIKFTVFAFEKDVAARAGATPNFVTYEVSADSSHLWVSLGPGAGSLLYEFQLAKGDKVHVFNDVIHVPRRCTRLSEGSIPCRDG